MEKMSLLVGLLHCLFVCLEHLFNREWVFPLFRSIDTTQQDNVNDGKRAICNSQYTRSLGIYLLLFSYKINSGF